LSPKESLTSHQKDSQPGHQKILWHWLYKHPVEFSKNNHTPTTTTEVIPVGATSLRYQVRFTVSSPKFRGLTLVVRSRQERATRLARHLFRRIRQAVHGSAFAPRSVRCPAGRLRYPTLAPAPNRLDRHLKQSPVRAPVEAGAPRHPPGCLRGYRIDLRRSPRAERKLRPPGRDRQIDGPCPGSHPDRSQSDVDAYRSVPPGW
jgi:hypothetical protein